VLPKVLPETPVSMVFDRVQSCQEHSGFDDLKQLPSHEFFKLTKHFPWPDKSHSGSRSMGSSGQVEIELTQLQAANDCRVL
jgi:hypothetical protein